MNLAGDILDKYSNDQVVSYLDKLVSGVLKNYQTAIKANQPEILYGNIGDIAQLKSILHEMNKRNQERAAMAKE